MDVDVKQEPLDPNEEIIKTEPNLDSDQMAGYWCSTKLDSFKNEHDYALTDTTGLVKFDIKQDIIECELPKIEPPFEFPEDTEYDDSVHENKHFPKIKSENTNEFKTADIIDDIKPVISEISEYVQFKDENELLTSHCDIPILKSEDYFEQPGSSKQTVIKSRSLKTASNVSKLKKRGYPWSAYQKNYPSSQSRLNQTGGHFKKHPVICKFCGKMFIQQFEFWQHNFIHTVNNKKRKVSKTCKICSRQFINKKKMEFHLKRCHINERQFKYKICSKEFRYKFDLQNHSKIHAIKIPFKCDVCFKKFKCKSLLNRHVTIHTNDKSFYCSICSIKCTQKCLLQQHLLIHENKKTYKCKICFKGFNQKSGLANHLKIHSNKKLFKCNICFKGFKRKYNLHSHLIIHNPVKLSKCDICSKEFISILHLQRHLEIHHNQKLFKCNICSKELKSRSSIQYHLTNYNHEKLKCNICSKHFVYNSHLQFHLISHYHENSLQVTPVKKFYSRQRLS